MMLNGVWCGVWCKMVLWCLISYHPCTCMVHGWYIYIHVASCASRNHLKIDGSLDGSIIVYLKIVVYTPFILIFWVYTTLDFHQPVGSSSFSQHEQIVCWFEKRQTGRAWLCLQRRNWDGAVPVGISAMKGLKGSKPQANWWGFYMS